MSECRGCDNGLVERCDKVYQLTDKCQIDGGRENIESEIVAVHKENESAKGTRGPSFKGVVT